MSRGLKQLIRRLSGGDETQREAAEQIVSLTKYGPAEVGDYVTVFDDLRQRSLLEDSAWFCLVADVIGEAAYEAVDEALRDQREAASDLQNDLVTELVGTIHDFLRANPLSENAVRQALDFADEAFDRDLVATPEREVERQESDAATVRLLEQVGCGEMAELFRTDPDEFRRRKQEGERHLTGRTYEEVNEELWARITCERGLPH